MEFLEKLDAFRRPKKDSLNPHSRVGGILVICAVGAWAVYAAFSVLAYLHTPDKITTAVVPSSMLDNNVVTFAMDSDSVQWGQMYMLPKVRAPAAAVATLAA